MTRTVVSGRTWVMAMSLMALAGALRVAGAQSVPTPPGESDPPGRAARLAVVQGAVSFRPAAGDTWALADQNRALTTGDRLWVDTVGRTELQIGPDAIRAASETELDIVRLDDHDMQFRLPQGSSFLHIKSFDGNQNYELDAPNAAITFDQAGEYRVVVSPDGQTTTVTAWSGQASVTAGGQSFNVTARQAATITGDSTATYNLANAGTPDNFDNWSESRDQLYDRPSASAKYVSEDMGGVADLDASGDWSSDADYGPVWYPTTVEADWTPYHYGHWVWEGRWGWTWVDDASWGWAPFHYGRWAYVRNRWGWCPGPRVYAPVFAPALVAFVGGNGWGVSVGVGGPAVGWFPLGPREVYYPAYRTGVAYRERINVTNYTNVTQITNVTNVTNIRYVNRNVGNSVTVVNQRTFANGEPVARSSVRVSAADLGRAPLAGHTAPVVPTARSLAPDRVGAGGRTAAFPPARLAGRSVVASHAPPPAPVPFATQQRALATSGGKPLPPSQLQSMRAAGPAAGRTTAFPVRPATAPVAAGHAALTPARPGISAARPVTNVGFAARTTTPTFGQTAHPNVPEPAAPAGRPNVAQPGRPNVSAPTPAQRVPAPAATRVQAPLDQEYQQQRGQMEVRHQQEFAKPPTNERPAQLQQRQEVEHQNLDQHYQQAVSSGAQHMPAPAPVQRVQAPRAQPQPQHVQPSRKP